MLLLILGPWLIFLLTSCLGQRIGICPSILRYSFDRVETVLLTVIRSNWIARIMEGSLAVCNIAFITSLTHLDTIIKNVIGIAQWYRWHRPSRQMIRARTHTRDANLNSATKDDFVSIGVNPMMINEAYFNLTISTPSEIIWTKILNTSWNRSWISKMHQKHQRCRFRVLWFQAS